MNKQTTTVTEIEYDASGRVVKETKTVTEKPLSPYSGIPQPSTWITPGGSGHMYVPSVYTATLNAQSGEATA